MSQTEIVFEHARENNPESEKHYEKNKKHFKGQCKKVFDYLMAGGKMTVFGAMVYHEVSSLPRRISDLREAGVFITDEWSNGENAKIKHWYMSPEQIESNKKFIK